MSLSHVLEAQERTASGTGSARAIRRANLVPAIVYGGKSEPLMVAINEKQLNLECNQTGFFSRILTLNVNGKEQQVLAKDIQLHPVTDVPLHVDFQRVDKNSRVHVNVPINFINEDRAPGVKRGGTLNIIAHKLEIICSPVEIPEVLTIDLIKLDMGGSVTLDNVTLPANVKPANPARDHVIATLVGGAKEADKEAE
ncbi:MAG: 50S ribosomal protein L25/general stress protein Ctc [Candidatus Paracaedibacteraceae bacterium]|nr:50S ribosomal protein L25/general stress protein Ctc [Candidatus Paracaedibacteraceae bacterium]